MPGLMSGAGRAYLPAMRWRLALLLLLALAAAPALAGESAAVTSERASVRLLSDADAVAPGIPFRVGLQQRLAPGWHTYWRNPGDAGAATEISVGLPDGGSAGPVAWPAPSRIPYGPLVNFGYEGAVLLPLTLTPPATLPVGGRFRVEVEATWLVCERLCIPEEGHFTLDLPVAAAPLPAAASAPAFAASDAAMPRPLPFAVAAGFDGAEGVIRFEGAPLSPARVEGAFFFPERQGVLQNAAAQPLGLAEGVLTLGLARGPTALPARLDGVLVLADPQGGRAAFAVAVAPGAVPGVVGPAAPVPGFVRALLFALLGGLILNLMPCVFPILAMKAFALARLGGAERRAVRAHAASYTLGVLVTFLVIGAGLVGLRAAGSAAGWGFQFSQPAFVAAISWLMLLVGLNLSGVFVLGGPVGAGAALAARGGHLGSFATGGLAVLVATPCTAPFMAAALGAALALPAPLALGVFAALGLGMAAPYALLALFPALARLLPRPGAWMERLKQALAFPMYGAAAWLVWVLVEVAGSQALLPALAGAVALAFAAWLFGLSQQAASRRLGLAALVPLLAALALLPGLAAAPPSRTAALPAGAEAWSEARVAALQAEGRAVFVNFTAAWCITCKVNEQVALNRDAVQAAFAAGNVAYLRGDWTRADPGIGAALRRFGREGVPLYLLYPPAAGAPKILPQILTEGIVLDALAATRLAEAR